MATCNADLSAEVEETEDEIVVTVSARNESSDDCADGLIVEFTDPLGDRTVADVSDGQELFVEGRPTD